MTKIRLIILSILTAFALLGSTAVPAQAYVGPNGRICVATKQGVFVNTRPILVHLTQSSTRTGLGKYVEPTRGYCTDYYSGWYINLFDIDWGHECFSQWGYPYSSSVIYRWSGNANTTLMLNCERTYL